MYVCSWNLSWSLFDDRSHCLGCASVNEQLNVGACNLMRVFWRVLFMMRSTQGTLLKRLDTTAGTRVQADVCVNSFFVRAA